MQQKLLFRETLVPQSKENAKEFTLEYYMVTTKSEHNGITYETYGVEVIKRCALHEPESKMINDIFASRDKVRYILDVLYRNLVTPVSLVDVIVDLMETDFDLVILKMGA